jgi:subtilisin family serine protease
VAASGNGYAEEFDNDPETTGQDVQGVSYPSSDPYALSVGAVWAAPGSYRGLQNGSTDALAVFSQRDDMLSDIFAPGIYVTSAWLNGGHFGIEGTSMASPQIAGMVALGQQLAERELGRRLTFDEVRQQLRETADPIIDGDDENDVVNNTGLTFLLVTQLSTIRIYTAKNFINCFAISSGKVRNSECIVYEISTTLLIE